MRARWLSVYLFYLLLAAIITWPLVARMDTHLAGFGYSDSPERAHHVWWLVHALRSGQPLFWLPNLGWPDGMAGITLLGHPLQHIPAALLALALPLLVADNLALLLQTALMGLGMYALGLRLGGGSRAAALIGGLVFMAAPTFQAHFGEGHNVHHSLAFAPLFVLALLRLRSATGPSRRRWFVAGALCFALVSGGHALNVIHMLLPLTTLLVFQRLLQRDWRGLTQLLLLCLAGALLQLLFVLPVFSTTLETRLTRSPAATFATVSTCWASLHPLSIIRFTASSVSPGRCLVPASASVQPGSGLWPARWHCWRFCAVAVFSGSAWRCWPGCWLWARY